MQNLKRAGHMVRIERRMAGRYAQQKMPEPSGPGIIFDGNRQPLCIF